MLYGSAFRHGKLLEYIRGALVNPRLEYHEEVRGAMKKRYRFLGAMSLEAATNSPSGRSTPVPGPSNEIHSLASFMTFRHYILDFCIAERCFRVLDAGIMSSQMSQPHNESSLVARCRNGDSEALGELWEICHGSLLGMLLSLGAERTEAEDVLADLWAGRPSILKKFNGICTLQSWLETLAKIRWVDRNPKRSRGAGSMG
jgi:hypothetical protein